MWPGTYRRIESTWIYRRIEIHPNNIIINGKVTSIGYNQMSEQMSYVLQQLMGFFKVCNISTFPQDYHFLNQSPHYICGMSVPPVMMAHVASRIWKYWLSKL